MADKLVLIDGNSILYRSFYALPALTLPDGRYTNAIYGFARMIVKAIHEIKPTHIAVAFDVAKKLDVLHRMASALGCKLDSPFMTMAFMSLLVIPSLKLSDRGLFDGDNFEFIEVIRN